MKLLEQLFPDALPKAIFFDLDGTLIDSVPGLASAIDEMLLAVGLSEAGEERVRVWVGNGAYALVEEALRYADDDFDDVLIAECYQHFLACYAKTAKQSCLYPNVKHCLQKLAQQNIELVLITNKPRRFTPEILEQHGIDGFFHSLVCGDDLQDKKPHPAPLIVAMERLNVKASNCLMVGDSFNDIAAANAANIKSVAVSYGYNHGETVLSLPASAFVDDLIMLCD